MIGSVGIAYALVAHFQEAGLLPKAPPSGGVVAADSGLDAIQACSGDFATAKARASKEVLAALEKGLVPLIYIVRCPDDPASGDRLAQVNDVIGAAFGRVLAELVDQADLDRAVVSGDDTTIYVCCALGIGALTAARPPQIRGLGIAMPMAVRTH